VPVSTNTLQRVIEGAGSPSSRRRIVAKLAELEADEGRSRPDAAKLRAIENMLLDSEIRDARMRFGSSGRTRFVTIFAHDPGMTEDELVEEERLWRAARSDD
jgi:hypothetical protein